MPLSHVLHNSVSLVCLKSRITVTSFRMLAGLPRLGSGAYLRARIGVTGLLWPCDSSFQGIPYWSTYRSEYISFKDLRSRVLCLQLGLENCVYGPFHTVSLILKFMVPQITHAVQSTQAHRYLRTHIRSYQPQLLPYAGIRDFCWWKFWS